MTLFDTRPFLVLVENTVILGMQATFVEVVSSLAGMDSLRSLAGMKKGQPCSKC